MLEKPHISETCIIICLKEAYDLNINEVTFLPLGNDFNTVVYRVVSSDGTPYFLKLRRSFDEASVAIPYYLSSHGIKRIISPLMTKSQKLSTSLDEYTVMLYPFIEGRHGFKDQMTDKQWIELSQTLHAIHKTKLPDELKSLVRSETFSPMYRLKVKDFMKKIASETFIDPTASAFAVFLKSKVKIVEHLLARAEDFAEAMKSKSLELSLCHSDIHAYNLLIESKDSFYIVDWDDPILAPKERDLMFVGCGMGICDTSKQFKLFYEGYGNVKINPIALTYYRFERIIQDIAEYCEQLLLIGEGGEDRAESLRLFKEQFEPNNVIDVAIRTENQKGIL